MIDQLYKKLKAVTALPPIKENEIIIRNLAHKLLNEINQPNFAQQFADDKEIIRQGCLDRIRLLNDDIILQSKKEDYALEKLNITSIIKNTLTACEILMCKTKISIEFDRCGDFYIETSLKLITVFITRTVRMLYENFGECEIRFVLKNHPYTTVLLVECVNNKQQTKSYADAYNNRRVLEKIGNLLSGVFLSADTENGTIYALSIKHAKNCLTCTKSNPDYVDLLIDKMSDVHIGLSGLDIYGKHSNQFNKICDLH